MIPPDAAPDFLAKHGWAGAEIRPLAGEGLLLSKSDFDVFRSNYYGISNEIVVSGYYLQEGQAEKMIHFPTLSKNLDGLNFQLMNFNFILYFKKPDFDVAPINLTKGKPWKLIERIRTQTGTHDQFVSDYKEIRENPKNAEILKRISSSEDEE